MIEFIGILFEKVWQILNYELNFDGITIKLYYPFMFSLIFLIVKNMIFGKE